MAENNVDRATGIILIGGSAGSFEVIFSMLKELTELRYPMVIILHRKSRVDSILTNVMSWRSGFLVKEAEEKETLQNGIVYIAPADYHMLIETDRTISLDGSEKINYSRPSIDVTFESGAQVFGQKCIGILLSGGNSDGVKGLLAIKAGGGRCFVQDPETAEIAFMPAQALGILKVDKVLKPEEIAGFISSLQ